MLLKINITCITCFVFVLRFCSWSQAEVFTAISDVEPLLQTHKKIIEDMKHYIDTEQKRLATLTKRLNLYTMEHEKAMEDIPNYLGNPINAFTLIKRLTIDLEFMRQHVQISTDNSMNITINHEGMRYPALEDLTGTAEALTRLQETYELDVHELSEGMLNGVVYSNPMTAEDCFEIGRALYGNFDYKNTLTWMTEALRKFGAENESYNFNEADILEYISLSHYYLADPKSALEWAEKIMEFDPKHTRAPANILLYKNIVAEQEANKLSEKIEEESTTKQTMTEIEKQYLKEYKDYKILCRGQMDVPAIIAKRLKCRYLTENHAFLRLAPIKMEYLYLQPDVVMFHDVMSDSEIEFIQETAKPRFKRAAIQSADTGAPIPANYRISKSAWLEDWESPVVARVSQRVADMTGLSMATAENLQVVNYGIGGHYVPHYDFTTKNTVSQNDFNGKRIATVLFYMSDVAQGGATVFTKLGLSVFPKKGAAAFWLNLHPSGEGDLATRHAACPVLRGSKWVSNKWLHEHTQEFLRPCNLEYQEEGVLRKLPRPVPKTSR